MQYKGGIMDTIDKAKETINENINLLETFTKKLTNSLPNIFMALIVFVLGYFFARMMRKALKNIMKKSGVDLTVIGFLSQVLFFCVIIIIFVVALGILGVPTNSFVAAIGGAGIAIGLALQSNLSNFASGMLILIFKPFKVGDFIETKDGVSGTVYSISMMNTSLNTNDNKRIYIPNSNLTAAYVINYSQNPTRHILINIKITYDTNHNKAIETIRAIVDKNDYVLNKGEYICEISELSPYYVNIVLKVLVNNVDYWDAYYKLMKDIKNEFTKNNIEFMDFKNSAKIQDFK